MRQELHLINDQDVFVYDNDTSNLPTQKIRTLIIYKHKTQEVVLTVCITKGHSKA